MSDTLTVPSTRRSPGQYLRAHTTDIMLPAALLVLIVIGLVLFPSFRSITNFFNILTFSSLLLIVAIGETFVVLGRAADLTVGSMVGFSGAILAVISTGMPAIPAVILAIVIGTLIGVVQGIIITKVKISFLIVTLGLYSLLRSQVQVLLGGQSQNVDIGWLQTLSNGYVGIIPNLVIVALVVFVVATLVLRGTGFGRALYAVGASPETARLAGIPVARVVIISFAISAFAASIAGLLTVGTLGSAQTTAGSGMELTALSAVLLGGTRFSGGYGSATRTLFGVLFLGVLNSLLFAAGISSFWQGTASGLVLILAVALDRTRKD